MKYKKIKNYLIPVFETPDQHNSWFGYYNYDPLSRDHTKLLCQRTSQDACRITKDMFIEIGYYDINTGVWNGLAESDSYNWPQGCMLQWIPNKNNEVIFNTSKNNHHIARIVNIDNRNTRDINWSIYGITPDGKKSITIDMDRAHWTRGYHYESVQRTELDVPVLSGDGIFEIDLENNTRRLIIPIDNIINTDYDDSFKNAKHWVEHIMINRSGTRFCFLHRFSPIDNVLNYTTRLFISNIDGSDVRIVSGWRDFDWSHFGWDGDDAFSIYTYERAQRYCGIVKESNQCKDKNTKSFKQILLSLVPKSIKKELKILIRGQRTYYQYYTINEGGVILSDVYKLRDFDIDGHQNYTTNNGYMIADTYPDTNQYQRIIIYNKEKKKSLIVGRIYAGLHKKYGSCDLHPKLSRDNQYMMVDTAFDGHHHMLMFKINWNLIYKHFKKYGK